MEFSARSPWLYLFTVVLGSCIVVPTAAAYQDGERPGAAPELPLRVFVSVPPLLFLARRVGGERVQAHSMVRAGHLPESYEPAPSQVAALSTARLFFRLNFPYEERLLRYMRRDASRVRVVDLHAVLEAEGSAMNFDPHAWNSPLTSLALARRMAAEFGRVDAPGRAFYQRLLRTLEDELRELDAELRHLLAPYRGRSFYVLHPAWSYFAARYDLVQIALEEEGVQPHPRRVAMLLDRARADGARVLFVQPWHHHGMAERFSEELGARTVELDPLSVDLPGSWRRLAAALLESWRP